MGGYVLGFGEIDRTLIATVGGKGANLGELSRIPRIRVPAGFCVTTAAYVDVTARNTEVAALLDELAVLTADETDLIRGTAERIRDSITAIPIPTAVADEVRHHLDRLGATGSYAVRSSATAEDLPTASFAGQQDTFLNVVGPEAILTAISRCWASMFTDRAVTYRIRNGFDHRVAQLAVAVQRMADADAAGIMFTADPISGNRRVTSIDAGFGLGEALVSGLANPDNYRVRDARIVERRIAGQDVAIHAMDGGGTRQVAIEPQQRHTRTLTDEQILCLERIGRTIEAHFGAPQDIEWVLAGDEFFIVQSRPITTLFPIPEADDDKNHVYLSFGHQQMMTDAMKPLGTSFMRLGLGDFPLVESGGRLFIDLAHDLASLTGRPIAMAAVKAIDPLIDSAVRDLAKRNDFMKALAPGKKAFAMGSGYFTWRLPVEFVKIYRGDDPATVQALIARNEAFIQDTQQRVEKLSGEPLFDAIVAAQEELKRAAAGPESMASVYVGTYAASWINKRIEKWLGEKGVADVLSQAVPNNLTSTMGLALLDVADVVRQHPAVMQRLPQLDDATFFEDLAQLEGGDAVSAALHTFLDRYGMRCPGEIDVTRPRWNESPSQLVPMLMNNISNVAPGAHDELVARGQRAAHDKESSILRRLQQLPSGPAKARKTKAMISRLRNFGGYREYPKYLMMCHYWVMKQALLREAATLVAEGVLGGVDDPYFLTFDEFRAASRDKRVDHGLIEARRARHAVDEKLSVPRVMTSEGEILFGSYAGSNAPDGALPGIAAAAGTVEGRARVIVQVDQAVIEAGDILVTRYTDPSWTPLFLSAAGLVTEVGGVATHGAVIAREYGLPAVVGVEGATTSIRDGQRVRVNGTEGYVEIITVESAPEAPIHAGERPCSRLR